MREFKLGQTKKIQYNKYNYLVAKVDDEDYDFLMQWKWFAAKQRSGNFYAVAAGKRGASRNVFMHREIMKRHGILKENKQVDHIDRDGLNNQKSNLRNATFSENMRNKAGRGTSRYIGVSVATQKHKHITLGGMEREYVYTSFVVGIKCRNGKYERRYGLKDEVKAALIYNTLAEIHHGEFANLNCVPIPTIPFKQYLSA